MNRDPSAVLKIKKGRLQSISRRHPWIFSGAVGAIEGSPENGDIVDVADSAGNFLCRGHFQNATIQVRILTYEKEDINSGFYLERLKHALERRKLHGLPGTATTMWRLVHGDGDQLPGLVADVYENIVVLQAHSSGMSRDIPLITDALKELLGSTLKGVYFKSDKDTVSDPYVYLADGVTREEAAEGSLCRENGHEFHIDWESGQKTGFFLDQRENRLLLSRYAKNKSVLNTFCYTGGFSVYAAGAGAARVISVDSSRGALDLTTKNMELVTGFSGTHVPVCSDVLSYFRQTDEKFDIIILDPPAFAKHVKSRHNAIQGYKRLNLAAIPKLAPGGLLFTFSCSQVVTNDLFEGAVRAAGIEAGRNIRILHRLGHPPDHPVSLFHPEGEYLKGLVLQVD